MDVKILKKNHCDATKRVNTVKNKARQRRFFTQQACSWDVSGCGIRDDFRHSLCGRWSSTGLLHPQLAAHAVVVFARARFDHLRSVVGALRRRETL